MTTVFQVPEDPKGPMAATGLLVAMGRMANQANQGFQVLMALQEQKANQATKEIPVPKVFQVKMVLLGLPELVVPKVRKVQMVPKVLKDFLVFQETQDLVAKMATLDQKAHQG